MVVGAGAMNCRMEEPLLIWPGFKLTSAMLAGGCGFFLESVYCW